MSTNYFVNTTNPEILSVIPRPGGLANIETDAKERREKRKASALNREASINREPSCSTNRKSLITVPTDGMEKKEFKPEDFPKQFKVKQIIAATPWSVEFDEYLEPSEYSQRIPDPFQDSIDMLAMTISVIMLLSKGYGNISESHFQWTVSYLKCIKDEFGQTPPNVQGILNHINQQTGGNIKSFLDDEPEEMVGKPSETGPPAAQESNE